MSVNNCALSGEPLQHPVISKKGGYIFEKRVIDKVLETSSVCPITGEPLSKDDLIEVKLNSVIKPRPINANSIPGLINIMQSEWDSLVAEMFTLKQHLDTTRKELSHALYQHDAACRVIARVVKERDEARQQVTQLAQEIQNFRDKGFAESKNGTSAASLPEKIINDITNIGVELNTARKARKKNPDPFPDYATNDMINNFKLDGTFDAFGTAKKKEGITCLDNSPVDTHVVLGSHEGAIKVFDRQKKKFSKAIEHHSGAVNDLSVSPFSTEGKITAISGGADSKAIVFSYEEKGGKASTLYEIKDHKDAITGVSFHIVSPLVVVGSRSGHYTLHDYEQGKTIGHHDLAKAQISTLRIHPDAQFVALAQSNGIVKLWNITANEIIGEIDATAGGSIKQISFSENGYHFATLGEKDHKARIWDLRYLTAITTVHEDKSDFKAHAITYDPSGRYFAVGGPSLSLHHATNYENFTKFNIASPSGTNHISAVKFGGLGKSILVGTSEGSLNIYK